MLFRVVNGPKAATKRPAREGDHNYSEVFRVFGMKDLMEKAQTLQSKIAEMQEQLADKTVTGSAGGDMVVVEITGSLEVVSVRIDRGLLAESDPEMLEDLVAGAVNAAIKKSKDMVAEEVSKLTGGIRLPGML